jgi:chemotaxis protein MotB
MRRRARASEESWLMSYADLITNLLLFFVVLLSAAQLSKGKMQHIARSISGAESSNSLESIRKEIDKQIAERKLQELVRTAVKDDGLEMALNSGMMFDSGQAALRPEHEEILSSMLEMVAKYSKQYAFAVEGHTDSNPIVSAQFPSNWELSTARAIAVRLRLDKAGVPRDRIRVEGYADTRPLLAEEVEGLSPPDRLARHRRVVVRMY